MTGVNLAHLYLLEDKYNFLRQDQAFQRRMKRAIAEIFHHKAGDGDRASYRLYMKLVGPFLRKHFAAYMYAH